ncbi:MAG: hypothetical protein ACLR0U_06495 [Enterocloster clostridioformis]
MKQVINGLYNLERFEFLPGIRCDSDIGEMTIENDLDPLLKELPEDIYPLLDTEKVGAYVRETENGVFTSRATATVFQTSGRKSMTESSFRNRWSFINLGFLCTLFQREQNRRI